MNKNRIMHYLNQENYMRQLHDQLTNGLIGAMMPEYTQMYYDTGRPMKELITPTFRAFVDMTANHLLYHVTEGLLDMVIDAVDRAKMEDIDDRV